MRGKNRAAMMYIKCTGELFFQTDYEYRVGTTIHVFYDKYTLFGDVIRKTKTGYVLSNWKLEN